MKNNTDRCLLESVSLKTPRKTASENVVCLCRLLNILADFSNLFCIQANSVDPDQTAPKLHLKMPSVYVVCWIFLQTFQTCFCIQANSVDPDQTAPKLHLKMSSVYAVCWIFLQTFQTCFCIQANSVDPDQSSLIWVHTVCKNDF